MSAARPAAAPPRPWSFPAVERRVLDTGLRLAVADLPGRPMAAVRLVFGASGGTAEDAESAGAGLLAARGLSEGTEVRSGAELASAIEALGADVGGEIRWDAFVIRLDVPASHLADALQLFGEVVRRPAFAEEELARLRQERLDQLAQERHDPATTAAHTLERTVFAAGSAYAHRLGGDETSIAALSRDTVADRYRGVLAAGAPTLVVAGDLSGLDVPGLAERALGHWPAEPATRPNADVAEQGGGRRVVIVDRPGSVQSALAIGHAGPPRQVPGYAALVLMSTCLGGVFGSRLNYRLREEKGYTYGAFSSFDLRRDGGLFSARTAVETSVTAPALEAAVEEIARMHDGGVDEAELAPVRDYRVGVFPIAYETPDAVAAGIVDLETQDLPDDHPTIVREEMRSTTAAEATRAAADHLRPDALAIVVVGDGAAVTADVEAAGLGPVTPRS